MDSPSPSAERRRGPRGLRDPREWHRDYPERKLAGVCASLARNLEISVSAVRIVFAVLLLFRGAGLFLYLLLWMLIPERAGEPAPLERWIRAAKRLLESDGRERRDDDTHARVEP